ncbi:MAG: hypothetical protein IPP19_01455 [Verrucomicrobia bacterium]|nr:hypothetical protein [Verrucomicrobiota bacterium]
MKNDPDDLDRLLQEWTALPAPSGQLASPVWQRIESGDRRASWFGNLTMLLRELEMRFARPHAIVAVVAVGLLVGVFFAEVRTRYNATQIDAEMSARYLSLLDVSHR